ncbi:MAG: hypothetical protein QGG40_00450 [Myxococcota bacterium]|nr:hypothetical protein [Myxococcota bacterium]
MSEKVDALFAGEPPPPPVALEPRLHRIHRLLYVAIPLDVLGIFCWTGVPGALLTLWAWLLADAERAHIEAQQVRPEEAARLARTRRLAGWLLGFCVFSLLLQTWLLTTPFYFELWQAVVPLSWQ